MRESLADRTHNGNNPFTYLTGRMSGLIKSLGPLNVQKVKRTVNYAHNDAFVPRYTLVFPGKRDDSFERRTGGSTGPIKARESREESSISS